MREEMGEERSDLGGWMDGREGGSHLPFTNFHGPELISLERGHKPLG